MLLSVYLSIMQRKTLLSEHIQNCSVPVKAAESSDFWYFQCRVARLFDRTPF